TNSTGATTANSMTAAPRRHGRRVGLGRAGRTLNMTLSRQSMGVGGVGGVVQGMTSFGAGQIPWFGLVEKLVGNTLLEGRCAGCTQTFLGVPCMSAWGPPPATNSTRW